MQDEEARIWVCEICGANVPVRIDFGQLSASLPALPQQCKLKAHSIGKECVAFRSLDSARELAKKVA
jgi:hypothetical protein